MKKIKGILGRLLIVASAVWLVFITVTFFWVMYWIVMGTNPYTDTFNIVDYLKVKLSV